MEYTRRNFFKIVAGIGGMLALQGVNILPDAIAAALPKENEITNRTIRVELINDGYTFYFPDIETMKPDERENSWVSVYVNDKAILELPCIVIPSTGRFNLGLRNIMDSAFPKIDSHYLVAFLETES